MTSIEQNGVKGWCTYNHASHVGIISDTLTVQLPVFLAVIINAYLYARGLKSLKRFSPQSVVSLNCYFK